MLLDNIKTTCRAKGLQLADVAQKMGVAPSSLSTMMRGNITLSKLTDIAGALGVSVSDLLADGGGAATVKCPACGHSFQVDVKARGGAE